MVGDIIYFLLLGLGLGSLYAMLSSGIVVAFKGSGVINFAHGALAMYAAFQFNELRTKGQLQLPWFDFLPTTWLNIPVTISLTDGKVNVLVAMAIALLTSVVLGLLVHFLVFRPLRNAAPLGKVIGAVGVMLYRGVALLNFGSDFRQQEAILPNGTLNNFLGLEGPNGDPRAFPEINMYVAGIAIILGVGLWAMYKFTRFGLATRAAAENEKGAVLLGYSPEFLAMFNWVIASVVAGFAGIIIGPLAGSLDPVKFTLLIVPALGAALIGNLSSPLIATFGGLALGMIEQWVAGYLVGRGWFPEWLRNGAREAVPLIIIAAVLYSRGKKLPVRGTVEQKRLSLSPYPKRVWQHAVVFTGVAILAGFIFQGKWSFGLSTAILSGMIMLSFVVLTGYVGQISLAQLTIAGIAAFFMARMMADGSTTLADGTINPFPVSGPGLPWWIAAVLGIVVATVVGVLLGLPALRIRGVQLAVVTIAATIAIQTLYFENVELTGLRAGSNATINSPTLFGLDIGPIGDRGLTDNPSFIIFAAVVLALLAMGVANLRRGGTGRRFLAVRANERAAAAAGIDVSSTKLLAFGISSAIAGAGGCMIAFQQLAVTSAGWTFFLGLGFLAFAYLGGITSINGAIVGGFLAPASLSVVFGSHHFPGLTEYNAAIGGMGLVLTAVIHPEGIAPFFQPAMRYLGSWLSNPTWAKWKAAIIKFGPVWVIGGVAGLLLWPARNADFGNGEFLNIGGEVWMVILGIFLASMIRSVGLRIYGAITGKGDAGHGHTHGHAPAAAGSAHQSITTTSAAHAEPAGAGNGNGSHGTNGSRPAEVAAKESSK